VHSDRFGRLPCGRLLLPDMYRHGRLGPYEYCSPWKKPYWAYAARYIFRDFRSSLVPGCMHYNLKPQKLIQIKLRPFEAKLIAKTSSQQTYMQPCAGCIPTASGACHVGGYFCQTCPVTEGLGLMNLVLLEKTMLTLCCKIHLQRLQIKLGFRLHALWPKNTEAHSD